MRAVFINHCHPATPHVCATRMREFATALSERGHKIILFTETLDSSPICEPLWKTGARLQQQSFDAPLHIAAAPVGFPLLKLLRQGRLPWGLRQLIIFWYFWRHQGVFTDWRKSSQPYLKLIAREFKPDIIWSTFGGSDCWNIAKDLSVMAGCPWVADIKDIWEVFIPSPFVHTLARCYEDAAALTTFSDLHRIKSNPFFPMKKFIVYSGLDTRAMTCTPTSDTDLFQISLTGSVYSTIHLETALQTINAWTISEPLNGKKVKLVYAGTEETKVQTILDRLNPSFDVELRPYLNQENYYSLLKSSQVNLYIRSEGAFHHKVFELMAARRTVICYPAETDEVIREAKEKWSHYYSCTSADDILEALTAASAEQDLAFDESLFQLDWKVRAEVLERILQSHIV